MITDTGIPDDSPDSTVRAIHLILKEEAEALKEKVEAEEDAISAGHVGIVVTLDLAHGSRWIRIFLSCIKLEHLTPAHGTIGTGFISWGDGSLSLEPYDHLTLEMYHGCPPYRWTIYPGDIT